MTLNDTNATSERALQSILCSLRQYNRLGRCGSETDNQEGDLLSKDARAKYAWVDNYRTAVSLYPVNLDLAIVG
jgi:hypothetical protein